MKSSETHRYEAKFAQRAGAGRAIAFAHARTALQAAASACGLAPGDGIVVSALTCKVVPLALLQSGYRVRYADVSPRTLNIEPRAVRAATAEGARAVLFQHTYGNAQGLEEVAEAAAAQSALLLEDRAQALVQPAPLRGRAAIYSNNLRKPLPAGSGGVAITSDEALADRIAAERDRLPVRGRTAEAALCLESFVHDAVLRPPLYWPLWRVTRALERRGSARDLQREMRDEVVKAALRPSRRQIARGCRALREVDALAKQRLACCEDYAKRLAGREPAVVLPIPRPNLPLFYFPILSPRKAELLELARRRGLELIAWPLHLPIYPLERTDELARYGYRVGSCPEAERVAERLVGLPTDWFATPARRDALIALVESS